MKIKFHHAYYKLAGPEFTTIRGKSWFSRLKAGRVVTVEAPSGWFDAQITGVELRRVSEMPVEFLKADAEYPGCTLSTRQQFVNLLNSLRDCRWAQASLESELTVIRLKKL